MWIVSPTSSAGPCLSNMYQMLHLLQSLASLGITRTLSIAPGIDCAVSAAGASTTDASQLGTTQVPDGPWVDELPAAWRSHMNAQLNAVGSKHSFRLQGGGRAGLWAAAPASKTVPLDQGSVSGILQHVSNESVRRQVG